MRRTGKQMSNFQKFGMALAIFGVFEVSGPFPVCHPWLTVQRVKQEEVSTRFVQLSKYFTRVPYIQFVWPGIYHTLAPRRPLHFSASTCSSYQSPARRRCNTV